MCRFNLFYLPFLNCIVQDHLIVNTKSIHFQQNLKICPTFRPRIWRIMAISNDFSAIKAV